ncbi:isochorismatase family protein [Corynebacterium mastitidis]|uniref:isochorismatase family protein n=1 Tax=Corynebacterium mastitidis TaxID=161890 RepID=UPI0003A13CAC|nr:isochorismatase family protein [Corynebacterium mastitidis]
MPQSLPDSIAYAMPAAPEDSAARWGVDPGRSALLIHDMQRHFLRPFAREQEPAASLVANVARLRETARAAGIPVFYTAQSAEQTEEERGLLSDVWGPGLVGRPEAAEIVPGLEPEAGDVVLTKRRYSAFARADLEERLRSAGRDQLVITGVYANIGCAVTAADAFMRDIQPFLVADAVADFSLEEHRRAVEWVAGRAGAAPDTAGVLAAWGAAAGTEAEDAAAHPGPGGVDLRALLEEVLGEDLSDLDEREDRLDDWGLDSVRLMTMITRLRESGVDVSFEEIPEETTFSELSELVHSYLEEE